MIGKRLRAVSFIIALTFAIIVLGSIVFISVESDHECGGVDCSVCEIIHRCEKLLQTTGLNVMPAIQQLAFWTVFFSLPVLAAKICSKSTLVSLKVELLN